MTIAVDDVCTDAQLDEHLGGRLYTGVGMLPAGWDDSAPARTRALRRTLQELARRSPPIREADITIPSELHDAVTFGACAQLYELAATSTEDGQVFYALAMKYEKRWNDELQSLIITGPAQERAATRAIAVYRR